MTLTIQDLGALGELLGSVAVLVTLIYLALQTRQNTMAIGAQLDAARIATLVNLNMTRATSTDLQEALVPDPADEAVKLLVRRRSWYLSWINFWQWQFLHARNGVLPSHYEPAMALTIQNYFGQAPGFADAWRDAQSGFRPESVEWVEEQRAKAA